MRPSRAKPRVGCCQRSVRLLSSLHEIAARPGRIDRQRHLGCKRSTRTENACCVLKKGNGGENLTDLFDEVISNYGSPDLGNRPVFFTIIAGVAWEPHSHPDARRCRSCECPDGIPVLTEGLVTLLTQATRETWTTKRSTSTARAHATNTRVTFGSPMHPPRG